MPTGVYVRTKEYRQKLREAMERRVNPGKNKSEETKRKIGDAQRGKPKSEAFRQKCRERMKGVAFFKGHKHSPENTEKMKKRLLGKNHWNWKGGIYPDTKEGRMKYSVSLRRRKNGFTDEIFDARIKEQNGLCAICGVALERGLTGKAASA